ncbi:MAG TPA: hypothetical protein DCS24_02405 [Erythrobacter sp.]|mgnify:CR=1 FL=1|nr:hypothetical protein [Erythrobacter sp.]
MSKKVKKFAKGGIATAAVSAMALAGATPAYAGHRDPDKIGAGEVIAGALIIGGLAAILSSGNKDRYRDGYRYRDRDYRVGYGRGEKRARRAINKCIRNAERDALRSGYRFADVTRIRDIDRTSYGWRVKGRLVVDGQRHYGYRSDRYGYDDRRYNYDRSYSLGADRGKFTCYVERDRVTEINYRGIRGLH